MPAGCQDQAGVLRSALLLQDRVSPPIGKRFHQQGMPRIDIVVVDNDVRICSPRLTNRTSQCLALQQIEIESDRKHEHFLSIDTMERQRIDRLQRHKRPKTENVFRRMCDRAGLLAGLAPGRVPAVQIRSEDECRCQRSFPPIRPCLVMLAKTSTMARTATSAVISEMS